MVGQQHGERMAADFGDFAPPRQSDIFVGEGFDFFLLAAFFPERQVANPGDAEAVVQAPDYEVPRRVL